jgi:hypothetical protein
VKDWTLVTGSTLVDGGFHRWWGRVICAVKGHTIDETWHTHGVPDGRYCRRCARTWRRDGCAARGCGQQAVEAESA